MFKFMTTDKEFKDAMRKWKQAEKREHARNIRNMFGGNLRDVHKFSKIKI